MNTEDIMQMFLYNAVVMNEDNKLDDDGKL